MNEITLKLTHADLAVIAAALGELPLKISKDTFEKINAQVAEASPSSAEPQKT